MFYSFLVKKIQSNQHLKKRLIKFFKEKCGFFLKKIKKIFKDVSAVVLRIRLIKNLLIEDCA